MTLSADLALVSSRVQQIAAMIASRPGAGAAASAGDSSGDVPGPADPSAGFDPFGVAYQQALVASSIDPSTNSTSTDGTDPSSVAAEPTLSSTALRTDSLNSLTGLTSAGLTSAGATSVNGVVLARPWMLTSASSVRSSGGISPGWSASSDAIAASETGSLSPMHNDQIGGYGDMPVPPELQQYGNGNVPPNALEQIGQAQHRLWAPAAESWKGAIAAAKTDGIDLRVTDSYRTYDQQVQLAATKGLSSDGGWAAVPGTSNHGWGLALDVDVSSPATMRWMQQNGHRFGWVEANPREPWHWEYRPAQA